MNLKLVTVYIVIIFFNYSPLKAQSAIALLQNMDLLIAAPKDKEASVLMVKRSFLKTKREIQKII